MMKSVPSLLGAGALALAASLGSARAADTVKVGVLHSLSGTMAISETSLRDVLLFTFDEINAKGGVLGKKIEPVVVDGASNWPLFAEKAKQLLEQDKVAVTFGCWTSVSRKSVLPSSRRTTACSSTPCSTRARKVAERRLHRRGREPAGHARRRLLPQGGQEEVLPARLRLRLPADHQPRAARVPPQQGRAAREHRRRVPKDESGKIISAGKYTPFGHTDYQQIVAEIKQFAASGDACVISTLNGDTNVPFFKEYAASGLTAETCPVVSFSISEDEFRGLPADKLVGQLGCWTYFQSINTPANKKFVADFQAWLKKSTVPGIVKEGRVTCSPMVL
jgi:urea transport system substrate-binding protein